jgi:hypothetical protein
MANSEKETPTVRRTRYPGRPVSEAVETLWRVVDAGHTKGITPELLAQAAGLRPRGEHLRELALSMRSLGLVKPSRDGLRVTRVGWELCEEPAGSARHRRLLWEIIHHPAVYAGLPNRFLRIVPSGEKLMDHLADAFALDYREAEEAAVNYREALLYAGLMSEQGERLVPELRVLPRYQPTRNDLEAVEPVGFDGEPPEPPSDYRIPAMRTPPAMPPLKISGSFPRQSGDLPAHNLDGHKLNIELGNGRAALLDLPHDLNGEDVKRITKLLNALVME